MQYMQVNAGQLDYDQDLLIESFKARKAQEISEKTGIEVEMLKGFLRELVRVVIEKKINREKDILDATFATSCAEQLKPRSKPLSPESFESLQMIFVSFILGIDTWYDQKTMPPRPSRPLTGVRSKRRRKS